MPETNIYISFHRMLQPWNEYSVWYDFTPQPVTWENIIAWDPDPDDEDVPMTVMAGGGIQADDVEGLLRKIDFRPQVGMEQLAGFIGK